MKTPQALPGSVFLASGCEDVRAGQMLRGEDVRMACRIGECEDARISGFQDVKM